MCLLFVETVCVSSLLVKAIFLVETVLVLSRLVQTVLLVQAIFVLSFFVETVFLIKAIIKAFLLVQAVFILSLLIETVFLVKAVVVLSFSQDVDTVVYLTLHLRRLDRFSNDICVRTVISTNPMNQKWGDGLGIAAAAPRETRLNAMMKVFGSMVLSEREEMAVLGTQLLFRRKLDFGKASMVKR